MNKSLKVLIVDDTPDYIKMLRNVLEPEGYRILVASDGETALRIAERTARHYIAGHPDAHYGWLRDVQAAKEQPDNRAYTGNICHYQGR